MHKYFFLLQTLLFLIALATVGCGTNRQNALIEKSYDVKEFGAGGDGHSLDTAAIQKAIDAASFAEGGTVILSNGTFLSGSLWLKDNVTLRIEKDAVLLGSSAVADYQKGSRWMALLMAGGARNISITGEGTIDGQGHELSADAIRIKKLKDPKSRYRPDEKDRPQLIEFIDCDTVQLKNITLKNSACWVETYVNCNHLSLDHVTVRSTSYWNNDGIDVVDCKNVKIANCDFDSADDGICLKSDVTNRCCENVLIENCKIRSSASALKLGTASVGGFKNITVNGLEICDTYRTAISLETVDGGAMEDIHVSNVKATHTGGAIFIRLGHRNKDDRFGTAKNITISDVTADIPADRPDPGYEHPGPTVGGKHNLFPSSITGLPEHLVQNVTLKNINVATAGGGDRAKAEVSLDNIDKIPEKTGDYPEFSMFGELPAWGLYARHVEGLKIENSKLEFTNKDYRSAVVCDDVRGLKMDAFNVPSIGDEPVMIMHKTTWEFGNAPSTQGANTFIESR